MTNIFVSFVQAALKHHHYTAQDRYYSAWGAIQRQSPSKQALDRCDKEQANVALALAACIQAGCQGPSFNQHQLKAWS